MKKHISFLVKKRLIALPKTKDAINHNSTTDKFVYDPMNSVPSYGGNVCCTGNAIEGGNDTHVYQ